jgi:prenylcysteine alpha-carboxyl methylesterase
VCRYNLLDLVDHFHNRGLYRSIFLRYVPNNLVSLWLWCLHYFLILITYYHCSIMEGEQSLKKFSPEIKIQDPCIKDSIPLLPRIILFHGTGDYSIPSIARWVCKLEIHWCYSFLLHWRKLLQLLMKFQADNGFTYWYYWVIVCSERFADALKKAGARADLILYDGKTHTDLFLQVS